MAICEQGQEKLNHLRSAARTARTDEEACRTAKKAAHIRCGIPIKLLGSEAVATFRDYHAIQRKACIWGGKIQEVNVMIDGDIGRGFLGTIDWIYGDLDRNGTVRLQRDQSGNEIDFNF